MNWVDLKKQLDQASAEVSRIFGPDFKDWSTRVNDILDEVARVTKDRDRVIEQLNAMRAFPETAAAWKAEYENAIKVRDDALEKLNDFNKRTPITLGVGDGSGNRFVYGNRDSIDAVQKMIADRDAALKDKKQWEFNANLMAATLNKSDEINKELRRDLAAAQAKIEPKRSTDAEKKIVQLQTRISALTAALCRLVAAKNEKDAHGETPLYQQLKQGAWENARAALETIS